MSLTLQRSQSQGKLSPSIINRIDRLSEWAVFYAAIRYPPEFIMYRSWNDDIEQLHKLAYRNIVKRVIYHSDDAKAISDRIQAITWSIQNLTVQFTCFALLSPVDWVLHRKQVESVLAVEFTLDVSELCAAWRSRRSRSARYILGS
jgi:hypothetical protein